MTITKLWKTISESMLECARPVVAAGVVDPAAGALEAPGWAVVKRKTRGLRR